MASVVPAFFCVPRAWPTQKARSILLLRAWPTPKRRDPYFFYGARPSPKSAIRNCFPQTRIACLDRARHIPPGRCAIRSQVPFRFQAHCGSSMDWTLVEASGPPPKNLDRLTPAPSRRLLKACSFTPAPSRRLVPATALPTTTHLLPTTALPVSDEANWDLPQDVDAGWERMAPITPRGYVSYYTETPPQIDGRLDDPAWRDDVWTAPFVDIEGARKPAPRYSTRAAIRWDEDNLYVAAYLEEPHGRPHQRHPQRAPRPRSGLVAGGRDSMVGS